MWLPIALCPSAAAGQPVPTALEARSSEHWEELFGPVEAMPQEALHTRKLAGFGVGVTLSAIVLSLDDVLGSSCFGSGSYLRNCRVGYVTAAAVAGGLGALVGRAIRSEKPPGRTTRILFGSAVGALGAFVASTFACEQEDKSNPASFCGYDGMVATRVVVGGEVAGGVLGALLKGGR